jgi:hypothetical protein
MSENPLMTSFIAVLLNLNAHGSLRLKPDIYVERNIIMVIGITVSMAQLAAQDAGCGWSHKNASTRTSPVVTSMWTVRVRS